MELERKEDERHMEHDEKSNICAIEIPEGENWMGDIHEKLLAKALKNVMESLKQHIKEKLHAHTR